jgi:MFS transporter, DHA1 family, inner membrane transport protein
LKSNSSAPLAPLLALTFAAFAIGTSELSIQGLLPELATGLRISVAEAGLLVTAYASGVAIGSPILAVATNGMRRKATLLMLLGVFVVGHALCAVAPNYVMLLASRIVASLCHGAFMGIGSVVAVSVVREDRRASAVALMWGGIAAANILGVPAGTALGQAFGWRATFWAIAALGILATVALSAWLPDGGRVSRTRLISEFRAFGRPQVLLALALGMLICAATFSVFTFIAPLLLEITGISPGALPLYLLAFGLGGVIGMQVGGRVGDRAVMASIIGAFLADVAVYVILLFALRRPAPALAMMFIWGFAFYFPAGPLQVRVVDAARDAPNLVSTLMQSGFNLGIAVGPFISAAALSFGLGYARLPWFGVVLAAVGAALALWSALLERRPSIVAGA